MGNLEEDAKVLWATISAEQMRLSRLAWEIDRVLHRLRLARVGSSGIEHRCIDTVPEVLAELGPLVEQTRKQFPLTAAITEV
jgi:hypothetical protein